MELREVVRSELSLAASLLARNYVADPSIVAFMGNVSGDRRERLLNAYFRVLVTLAMKQGSVTGAYISGELAGVGLYYPPGRYPPSFLAAGVEMFKYLLVLVPTLGVRKLLDMLRVVDQLAEGHPPEPHFYGEIGCVDERFRKHGVGRALSENLFRQADRNRMPIYAETSNPVNVDIWQRVGWTILGDRVIEGTRYWSMWRLPKV